MIKTTKKKCKKDFKSIRSIIFQKTKLKKRDYANISNRNMSDTDTERRIHEQF